MTKPLRIALTKGRLEKDTVGYTYNKGGICESRYRWQSDYRLQEPNGGFEQYPPERKWNCILHRLGFDPENDMEELIARLKHQNAIIPRSVFSHFVGSDDDSFDEIGRASCRERV